MSHVSVMPNEVMEQLDIQSGDFVVDGTLGAGGHSSQIADRLRPGEGKLLCCDIDSSAIEYGRGVLQHHNNNGIVIDFFHGSFADVADSYDWGSRQPNKILLDLGWSMDQFMDPSRGLSFMVEGPLDMRLQTPSDRPTAHELLHTLSESELVDILQTFGEETEARKIVRAIILERERGTLQTTTDLARVVSSVVRSRKGHHPATKTFQALRIAVNHEIDAIVEGIPKLISILAPGGILCVITFHSIEDRLVKKEFERAVKSGSITLVNKRVIVPSRTELLSNPRSRSAKMRCIRKNI